MTDKNKNLTPGCGLPGHVGSVSGEGTAYCLTCEEAAKEPVQTITFVNPTFYRCKAQADCLHGKEQYEACWACNPKPEPAVQPWMEEFAKRCAVHHARCYGTGKLSGVTVKSFETVISRHAPQDAEMEKSAIGTVRLLKAENKRLRSKLKELVKAIEEII